MAGTYHNEQLSHAVQFKQPPRVGVAIKNLDAVTNPPVNRLWEAVAAVRYSGSFISKPNTSTKYDVTILRASEFAPKTGTDTKDKGIYYEKVW